MIDVVVFGGVIVYGTFAIIREAIDNRAFNVRVKETHKLLDQIECCSKGN